MERIKASIIILTYNQEKRIGRAIDSVLQQRCDYSYEIVIADDDSSDSTRRIAEDYAERYPELIRVLGRKPNRGVVGNYFDAVEDCRGEYIGDCAGDDEWLDPMRLQRQIEMLDSDPGLSVVFSDVEEISVDAYGNITGRSLHSEAAHRRQWMRKRVKGNEILLGAINHQKSLPFTLSGALYRKSAIMEGGQLKDWIRMPEMGVEDVALIAALGAAGDGAYLPIVGYRYYIEGESLSNNLDFEKEFRFYSRVTRGCARLAGHYGIDPAAAHDHISVKLNHIAAQARHANRKDLIKEVDECAREWGVKLPLRAKLHILLLRMGITR